MEVIKNYPYLKLQLIQTKKNRQENDVAANRPVQ